MAEEIDSIINEINEELKNDQLLAFLKKYKDAILWSILAIVAGILIYSSWYSRKKMQMEEITNVILEHLQAPSSKTAAVIEAVAADAPSEIKPILMIMKSGKNLHDFHDMVENSDTLLSLTKKHGVDPIWKDLAIIIHASYGIRPADELIKLLEPLTADDRPFRFTALELIAMNYESAGNHEKAQESLQKIIDNGEAPKTQKKRISIILQHIKNNLEEKKQ